MSLDGELADWREIKDMYPWKGVLLGNGASMVVWPRFGYQTLFQVACNLPGPDALSETDQQLFSDLQAGCNLEQVLHDLAIALQVAGAIKGALRDGVEVIQSHYDRIRSALIAAVNAVHVPYQRVPQATLRKIAVELATYDYVFSTNYDLITYWSMMRDTNSFTDCFKDGEFQQSLSHWRRTKVYYLHGAIHLYRTLRSGTRKNRHMNDEDLLKRFGQSIDGEEIFPVFVSEGQATQKVQSIRESAYLTFAYEELSSFWARLVIFGNRLGEQDQHLVRAIAKCRERPIAISIRPGDEQRIKRDKAHYIGTLSGVDDAKPLFFDSTTHPCGDPLAFIWGDRMEDTDILSQLAPIKTLVLRCNSCGKDAFVVGRSSLCWACGYGMQLSGGAIRQYVATALNAGNYRVESGDTMLPPFRCPSCNEPRLVNVGLKRRGLEHDRFSCFNCRAKWSPGALASCPTCGNRFETGGSGERGCMYCYPLPR